MNNPDFLDDEGQRAAYLSVLRQAEEQTVKQLYEPKTKSRSMKEMDPLLPKTAAYMEELNTRRKGFQDTGDAVHASALQEVEQEREVAYEIEAVREVQKPVHYMPLSFPGLHRDITSFVKTGRLSAGAGGYVHAFVALRRTALGINYGISSETTASKLFVSLEFTRTISLTNGRPNDSFQVSLRLPFPVPFSPSYRLLTLRDLVHKHELTNLLQRPVNWVLWSSLTETAIVLIPEEAEAVIPLIHQEEAPVTHLLTYSAPVTRKMLHFNNLNYYAMPSLPAGWKAPTWLKLELRIFAGRLYFEYEEYENLRNYLGLRETAAAVLTEMVNETGTAAELDGSDGGADEAVTATIKQVASFTAKPLTFLQEWLAIRRKGQDFVHTPMGYVCQGKALTKAHPFFSEIVNDGAAKKVMTTGVRQGQKMNLNVGPAHTEEEYSVDDDDRYADDGFGEGGELLEESELLEGGEDVNPGVYPSDDVNYEGQVLSLSKPLAG